MDKPTKIKLLQIATEHFVDHGYDGARMDAIAKDSGFNKATFYYHFKSKEELYKAVLIDIFSTIDSQIQNINPADSPEVKLKTYISDLTVFFHANPNYSFLLMREVAGGAKNFNLDIFGGIGAILKVFTGILQEGVARGLFRPLPPILPHFMIIGTLSYLSNSHKIRQTLATLPLPFDVGLSLDDTTVAEYLYQSIYATLRSSHEI